MAGSLALIFSQQLRSSDHNIGQFRRAQRHAPGLAEDDRRSQSTAVIARPTLAVVAGRPQASFLLQPNVDRSAVVLLNCSERFAADVEHPKKSQRNEKILYAIAAVRKLSVCVRVSGEGNGGKFVLSRRCRLQARLNSRITSASFNFRFTTTPRS